MDDIMTPKQLHRAMIRAANMLRDGGPPITPSIIRAWASKVLWMEDALKTDSEFIDYDPEAIRPNG